MIEFYFNEIPSELVANFPAPELYSQFLLKLHFTIT